MAVMRKRRCVFHRILRCASLWHAIGAADAKPALLFVLRGVDHNDLVHAAGGAAGQGIDAWRGANRPGRGPGRAVRIDLASGTLAKTDLAPAW
jgi:hypothetical protein